MPSIRQFVDPRVVSRAKALVEFSRHHAEIPQLAAACAESALQAAGGMRSLVASCRAVAAYADASPALDGRQRELLGAVYHYAGEFLGKLQEGPFREALELLIMTAADVLEHERSQNLQAWARAVGLDVSPMATHDDDTVPRRAKIVEVTPTTLAKKGKVNKSTREIYQRQRTEDMAAKALALGCHSVMIQDVQNRHQIVGIKANGTSVILGFSTRRDDERAEILALVDRVQAELNAGLQAEE